MGPALVSRVRQPRASSSWQHSAWWSVLRFGLGVVLVSLILSPLAIPWAEHGSWWTAIRRCVSISAAVSVWVSITKLERRSLLSYGFSSGRAGIRQLFFGVFVGLAALGLMLVIGLASGVCHIAITPNHAKLWLIILGFIPASVIVSVLEELVFRGFILQQLLTYSTLLAVISSSGLYALVHLKTWTVGMPTVLELGGLFLLGSILSVSYLKTNQLYCAVGLHASLAYGARVNKLLIEFESSAVNWLVGTSRLVDGIANWVVLLVIGGILLWWMRPLPQSQEGGEDHGNL